MPTTSSRITTTRATDNTTVSYGGRATSTNGTTNTAEGAARKSGAGTRGDKRGGSGSDARGASDRRNSGPSTWTDGAAGTESTCRTRRTTTSRASSKKVPTPPWAASMPGAFRGLRRDERIPPLGANQHGRGTVALREPGLGARTTSARQTRPLARAKQAPFTNRLPAPQGPSPSGARAFGTERKGAATVATA